MSWLGSWAKRIELTVSAAVVDATLTDFPVMVKLSAASGIGDVDASPVFDELTSDANRKKIAVTSSDGTTELYCEIEKWDDANELAWLHIKVPSISSSVDTIIYLYYDSAQTDNTTYIGDTTDAVTHNVWDANFKAVYHMAQDPNGDAADAIKDSTVNANDGTPVGSMLTADLVDGKVGKGLAFDGTDDCLETGIFLNTSNDFTVSGCVKTTDKTVQQAFFGCNDPNGERSYVGLRNTNYWSGIGSTQVYSVAADEITNNVYFHWALVANSGTVKYYINGTEVDSHAYTGAGLQDTYDNKISAIEDVTGVSQFLSGIQDEVSLSLSARSAAWIKATYNSLWDSLITFVLEGGNVNVEAATATLTITPNATTVIGATTVTATTASLTITPNAATVVWGIGVNANTKSLTITPNAATVRHDHDILAATAALTIAPQAATVSLDASIVATTATLTITPFAADVEADIVHVNATTATLAITANAAVVKYDIPVNATTATLTITPNAATVWDGAAWAVWIAANESRATKYYYFILTGDADSLDDVTIPISSFQARRSYTSPTYLSVVIKDLTYATAISNRPNGDMQILMEYEVAGVIAYSSVIVEVDFEDITIDEGGGSSSISLVGRRTESYTPKAILLDNLVYGQLKNGKYRYRASIPNLYLSPGDTVTADGNEFVVDQIQYIVSPIMQMMEVRET